MRTYKSLYPGCMRQFKYKDLDTFPYGLRSVSKMIFMMPYQGLYQITSHPAVVGGLEKAGPHHQCMRMCSQSHLHSAAVQLLPLCGHVCIHMYIYIYTYNTGDTRNLSVNWSNWHP